MAELGSGPTLRAYLVVLRRRKWWVISLAVLGLVITGTTAPGGISRPSARG